MQESVSKALTVGEIARRLDEPIHRVEYVIRSRGIRPAARAGSARVFTGADLARIAAELHNMDGRREGGAS